MNKFSRFLNILYLSGLVLLSGCGGETIPDPPMIRSKTVIDTFIVLAGREHKVALKKILRLREIDPGNVFLANLEIAERNNSVIDEAQSKINEGDLKSALTIISDGIRKYGRHSDLLNAEKKLKVVTKIQEILAVFKNPQGSNQLIAVAETLKKIGNTYKPASIFIALADTKLAEAEVMNQWEIKRAIASLCSHLNTLHQKNDPDIALLYAVLELEDPDHPMLVNYLEYLNGNEDIDLIIYPEENIFADEDEESSDKTEEKTEEKEEEKGGWWNRFSF